MGQRGEGSSPLQVVFGAGAWRHEVERLRPRSTARLESERARRQIEARARRLRWLECNAESADGTWLPNCWKLYVPLDATGASAAPFGFVFRLTATNAGPVLQFVAFGERHPRNSRTKSVYERAHRRLHGRYP
jgi:hypothetical protein